MARPYTEILNPERVCALEPDCVAALLLEHFCEHHSERPESVHNIVRHPAFVELAGSQHQDFADRIVAASKWLEREGAIVEDTSGYSTVPFYRVTPKGRDMRDPAKIARLARGGLLTKLELAPDLERLVRPDLARGDFADAVFKAFREVEVRVRAVGDLRPDVIDVKLMREAFQPERGPLTDMERTDGGEREAMMQFFAGGIGLFKNPFSHRNVTLDDPQETAELIMVAAHLLRIVAQRERAISAVGGIKVWKAKLVAAGPAPQPPKP